MTDTDTLAASVEKERARVAKERERLLKQQQDIQEKIAELDRQLHAAEVYQAALEGKPLPGSRKPGATRGPRRTGIRSEVFALVKSAAGGLTRAELLTKHGIASDDTSGQQSVSNALSALKRAGKLTQSTDGKYVAQ